MSIFSPQKEHKAWYMLLHALLAVLVLFLATFTVLTFKRTQRLGLADNPPRTIMISGSGKAVGIPDIATVNLGLITERRDVLSAQRENSEKMNQLLARLKDLQIPKDDIQTTQYQIYPRYDYTKGAGTIVGYTVSQSVSVKIRDLGKVSAVLAAAGEVGANQVSGVSFTLDDPEDLRQEARTKAIGNAKDKARDIARALGLKLGRIVSFNESSSLPFPPTPYARELGFGGGGDTVPPQIESGTVEVNADVSVTFELE